MFQESKVFNFFQLGEILVVVSYESRSAMSIILPFYLSASFIFKIKSENNKVS